MKYFVRYSVKYDELVNESGIVCATDLGDAANQIEEFYSDTLYAITRLEYMGGDSVLCGISDEAIDMLEKEAY